MICSNCGAENASGRKFCIKCHISLRQKSEASSEKAENITTENENNLGNTLRISHKDTLKMADASNEESKKRSFSALIGSSEEDFDDYEDDYDESIPTPKKPKFKKISRKLKRFKRTKYDLPIFILAVLFALILALTSTLVYRQFFYNGSDLFAKSVAQLNVLPPQISVENDENKTQYIKAKFYGAEGDKIYLGCNEKYYTFEDKSIELDLYLSDVYGEDKKLENTVDVDLNAYHVRGGKHYAYNLKEFTLTVPTASLEFAMPKALNDKSYSDNYLLKFWVLPGSTVKVNDVDVSSYADGLGNIEYSVSTPENTSSNFNILVSLPYCKSNQQTVVLSRDATKSNLTIKSVEVQSKTAIVSFVTDDSATVTANIPFIEEPKTDSRSGISKAVLDLSGYSYGDIQILLTAETTKGKTTKSYSLNYWPNADEVSKNAVLFSAKNATAPQKSVNYLVSQAKIIKSFGANTFEASCQFEGTEYNFLVRYSNSECVLEIGKSYKIFMSYTGSKSSGSGLRLYNSWFIYNN